MFRRFSPLSKYLAKLNGALSKRGRRDRALDHHFKLVSRGAGRLATRASPSSSRPRTTCSRRSPTGSSLRESFQELPSALTATREAVDLGRHVRAGARPGRDRADPVGRGAEAGAGGDAYPFFRDTEEPIREQITPFARNTQSTFDGAPQDDHEAERRDAEGRDRRPQGAEQLFNALGLQPGGRRGGLPLLGELARPQRAADVDIQDAEGRSCARSPSTRVRPRRSRSAPPRSAFPRSLGP